MKRAWTLTLVLTLLLGWAAPAVIAQDDEAGPRKQGPRHGKRMGKGHGRGHRGHMLFERMKKALELTDEQEEQIQQILETQKQAVENWRKENGEAFKAAMKKLKEARQSGDEEAMEAARAELKELGQGRKALHENLMKQLGDVLTEEQLDKAQALLRRGRGGPRRPGGRLFGALRRLDLTEQQQAQVKEIMDAAKADIDKLEDRKEKAKRFQAAAKTIVEDVLTDEQRQQLEKMKPRRGPRAFARMARKLGLTDEQKAQARKIMDEARQAAQQAETREAKREIFHEAIKKVHEDVLTEEQRAKVEQFREKRRDGRGPRRGRRGGRRRGKAEEPTAGDE